MIVNGTTYDDKTDPDVVKVLEAARESGTRIRLHYGDRETGRDWLEECEVNGTVGRSGGTVKIPLLIATSRSLGGGGILDRCIVRITSKGRDLYRAPNYKVPTLRVVASIYKDRPIGVHEAGGGGANFKTEAAARRYIAKFVY
jgi:hypothetical protein